MFKPLLLVLALLPQELDLGREPPSPEPPAEVEKIREWAEDRLRDFYLNPFRRPGMELPPLPAECDADEVLDRACFFGDIDALPCPWQPKGCKPHKDAGHFFLELQNALHAAALRVPDDPFVMGQAVYALAKGGDYVRAHDLIAECAAAEWLCLALDGFVHYSLDERDEAAPLLSAAHAAAPEDVRCRWDDIGPLLASGPTRDEYVDLPCGDARRAVERTAWWLADPLWLAEGNDRWIAHLARRVEVDLHQQLWGLRDYLPYLYVGDSRLEPGSIQGYPIFERHRTHHQHDIALGGQDRGVIAIGFPDSWRWDPESFRSFSREPVPGFASGQPANSLPSGFVSDPGARRWEMWVSERKARYRFFPGDDALSAPTEIGPAEWDFEPGVGHERFTPDYGRFTPELTYRRAHFLRGDSSIVVLAMDLFRIAAFADLPRAVGLFFARSAEHDPVALFTQQTRDRYVFRANVRDAPHVMSLEVVAPDLIGRARHGVDGPWREEAAEGQSVTVSDLLLYEPFGRELPDSLSQVTPFMRATPDWEVGAEMGVFWEVYGVRPGQGMSVSVGVGEVSGGLLARIGRAITFRDAEGLSVEWREEPAAEGSILPRAVTLDLNALEPGDYVVEVRIEVDGQSPVRRRIDVRVVELPPEG